MKTRTWLGGLLAAQLVLATGLFLHDRTSGNGPAVEPLLAFATADIDRIVIDDNAASTTLSKVGEEWQIADLPGVPVNTIKLNALLETLGGLETTWPVVSSAAGRERFEVTEERYQRKLGLYRGDTLLGEYYFGTSPGFRQTHARRANDDEVYALAFTNFDLPGDRNDWLDKGLLAADSPERIKGPDFEIAKHGEDWQLNGVAAEAGSPQLDQNEVKELVSALSGLRVMRIEQLPAEGERVQFEVSAGDASWRYEFARKDDKYYVKRSDQEQAFTISQSDYERIAGKNRGEIVQSPEAPAADAAAEPDEKV